MLAALISAISNSTSPFAREGGLFFSRLHASQFERQLLASRRVRLIELLCSGFQLPTREDQHGRMAMQRGCQNLCALDAKVDPAGFDAGNGGLRDAAE